MLQPSQARAKFRFPLRTRGRWPAPLNRLPPTGWPGTRPPRFRIAPARTPRLPRRCRHRRLLRGEGDHQRVMVAVLHAFHRQQGHPHHRHLAGALRRTQQHLRPWTFWQRQRRRSRQGRETDRLTIAVCSRTRHRATPCRSMAVHGQGHDPVFGRRRVGQRVSRCVARSHHGLPAGRGPSRRTRSTQSWWMRLSQHQRQQSGHDASAGCLLRRHFLLGNSNVTFEPGIYELSDGGLTALGQTALRGEGVGFYLSGNASPIIFGSGTHVSLTAPTDGAMAGLLIFEDPRITVKIEAQDHQRRCPRAARHHLSAGGHAAGRCQAAGGGPVGLYRHRGAVAGAEWRAEPCAQRQL